MYYVVCKSIVHDALYSVYCICVYHSSICRPDSAPNLRGIRRAKRAECESWRRLGSNATRRQLRVLALRRLYCCSSSFDSASGHIFCEE